MSARICSLNRGFQHQSVIPGSQDDETCHAVSLLCVLGLGVNVTPVDQRKPHGRDPGDLAAQPNP